MTRKETKADAMVMLNTNLLTDRKCASKNGQGLYVEYMGVSVSFNEYATWVLTNT